MLSIFPDLLNFSQLAPTLLRLVLGIMAIWKGISIFFRKNCEVKQIRETEQVNSKTQRQKYCSNFFGIMAFVCGISLLSGVWVQITAIAVFVWAMFAMTMKAMKKEQCVECCAKYPYAFYILTAVSALTLLVSGAGLFAVDLPL